MFGIETISRFLGIGNLSGISETGGIQNVSQQDLLTMLNKNFGNNSNIESLKKAAAQIALQYNIPAENLTSVYDAIDKNDYAKLISLGTDIMSKYNIDVNSLQSIAQQYGINVEDLDINNLSPSQIISKELPGTASTVGSRTLAGIGIGLAAGSFLPGLGTAVGGILGGITGFLFGAGKAAVNLASKYSGLLDYIV